jgi:hypothetical protein
MPTSYWRRGKHNVRLITQDSGFLREQLRGKIQKLPRRLLQCMSPLLACAVKRRRFPVGASPTRQPLQPEATGAVMEVTKWLKPSDSVSRYTVTARVCSKRTMRRPTRLPFRGRLIRLGEGSKAIRSAAARGYWRQHVHKESARNTGDPKAWSRDDQPDTREG